MRTLPGPAADVPKRRSLISDGEAPSPLYTRLHPVRWATKLREKAEITPWPAQKNDERH